MVILDMIMPDMGGGRVYDQLKTIDPLAVKVLLSSGYSINRAGYGYFGTGLQRIHSKTLQPTDIVRKSAQY